MVSKIATSTPWRTIASHFQRSINLTYDSGNSDYVRGYIPTPAGAQVLANLLKNSLSSTYVNRAHVLHAPYGSGKSLLSLVLSTLIEYEPDQRSALDVILDRVERYYPEDAFVLKNFAESGKTLLPVILSGDEGSLTTALLRGLNRAVGSLGLGDFQLRTPFLSALNIIASWEKQYPEAYFKLVSLLQDKGVSIEQFNTQLQTYAPKALEWFAELHPQIAAGARFEQHTAVSLPEAYHETALKLKDAGYDGIFIIWDEFGRYMEAKAEQAFGFEAALLQEFAEFCNRSGETQVHLVLITHRLLSTYAADLPIQYQQEWGRIAERFWSHDLTSDPSVVYRLVAEAFTTHDQSHWERYLHIHEEQFRQLTTESLALNLFEGIEDTQLRVKVIEASWPLHPLTIYALPRLSAKVAQNERTLFTFLASAEPYSLQRYLPQSGELNWYVVGLHTVWDYFAEGIRHDIRAGGSHSIWSGVVHALSKVEGGNNLGEQLVKILGILTIIEDVNSQKSWLNHQRIAPTTSLLAWAAGVDIEAIQTELSKLSQRNVVRYIKSEGVWRFTRGSDIDVEQEIAHLMATHTPTQLQLRQLLQTYAPLSFHLPRGHNLSHRLTRYFHSLYRWGSELSSTLGNDESLKQLGGSQGKADGVVVYVLPQTAVDISQTIENIKKFPDGRVVYVIPHQPLHIEEPLRELYALRELTNNPQFIEQDRDRLPRELQFFIEDAQRRLERALYPIKRFGEATWLYYKSGEWLTTHLPNTAHLSRLLSELCELWFSKTPKLNNELLNLTHPSAQQINACIKVIDSLLKRQENDHFPFDLGLEGFGPDRLILRTILVQTGLLQPIESLSSDSPEQQKWYLATPFESHLEAICHYINHYLEQAKNEQIELAPLLETLQLPPYGLRLGVLPILLATVFRSRIQVITLRHQRKVISPITGKTFIDLCAKPEEFTIQVGVWDERRKLLWQVLERRIFSFLALQEHELQPLSYISIGLLRWLQSLPRFCRDTIHLSTLALKFRDNIRKAQREPAQVLLYDLLDILDDGVISPESQEEYTDHLGKKLSLLMDEIADAYQALRYDLDRFAEQKFTLEAGKRLYEGQAILTAWLNTLDQQVEGGIKGYRFSDDFVERFVSVLRESEESGRFWERLSHALIGVSTSDWNDASVENFKQSLLNARTRLEQELFAIQKEEDTIELQVHLPGEEERVYRFHTSELSKQGQFILENFKTTLAIAGRPLSPDEKRQVALAFLHYILEGNAPDEERKNKSLRGHS